MSFELETEIYQTKPELVWAARVTSKNLAAIAERTGGELFSYATKNGYTGVPFVKLQSAQGTTNAKPGMWVVYNGNRWIAMTSVNFQKKYEKMEVTQ